MRRAQGGKRRGGRRRILKTPVSVVFSLAADVAGIVRAAAGSGRVTAFLRLAAVEYVAGRRPAAKRFRPRVRGVAGLRSRRNRRASLSGPAWRFNVEVERDTREAIRELGAGGCVTMRTVLEDAVATCLVRRIRAAEQSASP